MVPVERVGKLEALPPMGRPCSWAPEDRHSGCPDFADAVGGAKASVERGPSIPVASQSDTDADAAEESTANRLLAAKRRAREKNQ